MSSILPSAPKPRRLLTLVAVSAVAGLLPAVAAPLVAQPEPDSTVVVAPGSLLVPRAADGVEVEAAWGDEQPGPVDRLTAPQSGEHRLVLRSRDRAGVLSEPRRWRIVVDGAPPELALRLEPPGSDDGAWAAPGARAVLVAEDRPAGIADAALEVVAGGASPADGGPPSVRLPGGGSVALAASASDHAGNRAERRFEIGIDGAPPVLAIEVIGDSAVGGRGWTHHAPEVTLQLDVADRDSGLSVTTLELDGRVIEGSEWSGRLEHGWHQVDAVAVDRVGNRATASRRFEVDAAGPEIRWEPGERRDRRGRRRPTGRLSALATDTGAGGAHLEWSASPDGPWRPYRIGKGPKISPVYFRARDLLGNRSALEVRWKGDGAAPEGSRR